MSSYTEVKQDLSTRKARKKAEKQAKQERLAAEWVTDSTDRSSKTQSKAFFLNLLGLVGIGGLHCFYIGRYKLGVAKLLTFNFFFLGTLFDMFHIALDKYRDKNGKLLKIGGQSFGGGWWEEDDDKEVETK